MTKTQETSEKAPRPTNDRPLPEQVDSSSEATQAQRERLQACMAGLRELLELHRCQILPRFGEVIPVGTAGDTIQIKSTWDLGALPDQP